MHYQGGLWQPSPGIFLALGRGWGTHPPTAKAVEGEEAGLEQMEEDKQGSSGLTLAKSHASQDGFRNLLRFKIWSSVIWGLSVSEPSRGYQRQLLGSHPR